MKKLIKPTLCALLGVALFLLPLAVRHGLGESAEQSQPTVLVLWHVDGFEGGTGSRKDFLLKSALAFEREHKGVLVSVISHTLTSIDDNISRGCLPDMISFSPYAGRVTDVAKPLKSHKNNVFFNACTVEGKSYAYPYAYGMYVKITTGGGEGNTTGGGKASAQAGTQASEGGAVLSVGENNYPGFIALRQGEEYVAREPTIEAYTHYLSGRYSALLGTQRDVYRLSRRGVDFNCEAIGDVTDLVQYIAVTAEGERYAMASAFANYLVGEDCQMRLEEIGLFSPAGYGVRYDVPQMNALAQTQIKGVLSPFIGREERGHLRLHDGEKEFFEKFVNYVRF